MFFCNEQIKRVKTMEKTDHFNEERERLNQLLIEKADTNMKRFLNLETHVYQGGALPKRSKEMLGLVASLVLRCDDCIHYHLIQCRESGITDPELMETLLISVIVGGSVTIPHVRRALDIWDGLSASG
jgi:AhpD family alkylhydroperoxidase